MQNLNGCLNKNGLRCHGKLERQQRVWHSFERCKLMYAHAQTAVHRANRVRAKEKDLLTFHCILDYRREYKLAPYSHCMAQWHTYTSAIDQCLAKMIWQKKCQWNKLHLIFAVARQAYQISSIEHWCLNSTHNVRHTMMTARSRAVYVQLISFINENNVIFL